MCNNHHIAKDVLIAFENDMLDTGKFTLGSFFGAEKEDVEP